MNTPESLELSHELERNLSRLERRQRLFVGRALEDSGFNGSMYRYIKTIHRHPGISQDQLAEFHTVDKSWVARVVRQMETQGYLERRPDEANRRCYQLTLTPKGEELYTCIHGILSDWGERVTEGIPRDALKITLDTIGRMIENSDKL